MGSRFGSQTVGICAVWSHDEVGTSTINQISAHTLPGTGSNVHTGSENKRPRPTKAQGQTNGVNPYVDHLVWIKRMRSLDQSEAGN